MDAAFTIYDWRQNRVPTARKAPHLLRKYRPVDCLFGTQPTACDAAGWSGPREEVRHFCEPT